MDEIVQNKNLGEVAFSDDVILSIITRIISDLDGIKNASSGKRSKLISIVSKTKDQRITMEKDEDNRLIINIPISVKYGLSIKDVTKKLQDKIKNEIEHRLGLAVKEINIEVVGIEK